MAKLNVGFIGLGRIADVHYPGYKNNKEARLFAVCDTNEDIALRRKKEWKAKKHYTDYRELLNDPEIDAVEILTPHSLHEQMTIDAATAGKHIALQKPMTISLESADKMIQACKENGKVFRITDNYAFYPPIVLAKKIIDNGEAGDPINLRIKMIGGGAGGWDVPQTAWQWRLKENQDGGGSLGLEIFDHGHHLWTTAWYLMGKTEYVSAWIDSIDGIIDSPAMIMWKFKEGYFGATEFSHSPDLTIPSRYYANDEWIEVTGTKGIIVIHRCTGNIMEGPAVSVFTNRGWKHYSKLKCDWGEGFKGATKNFINAINGKEKPMLKPEDAREILKFSLAIHRSSQLQRQVFLDEMDSSFPKITYWKLRRREIRKNRPQKSILEKLGLSENTDKYADRAENLTKEFIEKFDGNAAGDWQAVVGLHVEARGGIQEMKYSLAIKDQTLNLEEGTLPHKPDVLLKADAGTWAAILLKKKKIEMAYLQGKLKIEGKAEEALKLRAVFGI